MTTGTAFLLVATSLIAACDPVAEIDGEAVVPPSVQTQFSKEKPGLLVVQTDYPDSDAQTKRVHLLCEPLQGQLRVKFSFSTMPCFEETKVRAWIEPGQAGPCGKMIEERHVAAAPEKRLASGETTAFKGKGCSSGTSKVRIELMPKSQ